MNPEVKALAVFLLKSGEMRVAEVAELLGQSRQTVALWCPNALAARRKWCARRWREAIKAFDPASADRAKREIKSRKREAARDATRKARNTAVWAEFMAGEEGATAAGVDPDNIKQLQADYNKAETDEEVAAAVAAWERRTAALLLSK